MNSNPKAIRDRFYAEDLGDQTVVFDAATRRACSLNSTASFVWKQCDGETSLDEIGQRVSAKFQGEDGSVIAALAVEELSSAGMLEAFSDKVVSNRSFNRRELLSKAAALGVLVPIVAVGQTKPPKKHTSFVPKTAKQGGSDF